MQGYISKMTQEELVRGQLEQMTSFSGFKLILVIGLQLVEWPFKDAMLYRNGYQVSAFHLATMECFLKITRRMGTKGYTILTKNKKYIHIK